MKKLQNLKGATALNKKEQQTIKGGGGHVECETHQDCPGGQGCCFAAGLCFRDDYPGLQQPGGSCWL